MPPRTVYLPRLLGLFMVIVSAACLIRSDLTVATTFAVIRSAPLILLFAMLTLAAGLAILLYLGPRPVSASPRPVGAGPWLVVTIIGWGLTIKGIALLLVPQRDWIAVLEAIQYRTIFVVIILIPLCLGLYLSWAGFRSTDPT
jgi:hypothetical protein